MSRVKLFEIQEQALAAEDAHRAEHPEQNRLAVVLPTGTGKGHPLETEVPTPAGWRRWGDLEPGDEVFGRDGSSTEVLEVFDRGVLETYRVTFSDGSSVLVDGDHLWAVKDAHRKGRLDQDVYRTLSTRDLATVNVRPMDGKGYRWHLPMTAPLERKPRDLPLDPYVVGALISNGSLVGSSTQLTTPDLEVAARVGAVVTCRKVNDRTPGVCDRYFLHGLVPVTRELGMRVHSRDKRVPAAYLEGSLEQRIDLLHGLMDGDGGARDSSRRSVGYFTSSPGLARDVSELVTSLGGTGTVKRYDRGARGVEYAVRVLLPSSVPAFSTSRKSHAGSSSTRNLQPKRVIVSIALEGRSSIRCIRVAAPDSLYLIGRQHIVTHNTTLFSERARRYLDHWRGVGEEHYPWRADDGSPIDAPTQRVLILVHTDELTDQAEKRARFMCAPYSVGVVKADRDEVDADVIVASVQTLSVPGRKERITDVGYVIVDEVQYGVTPMWTAILEHFGCIKRECQCRYAMPGVPAWGSWGCSCPKLTPMLGVTATLARSDGQGFGDLIHEAVYTRSTSWAIRKGYLIDVIPYTIKIPEIDASASDARLDAQLADSIAPEAVVHSWAGKARGWCDECAESAQVVRDDVGYCVLPAYCPNDGCGTNTTGPSTVLFAPLVKSAQAFADSFNNAGVKAEVVHGAMPKAERKAVLERYEAGITTVVCNAMALTVGWDSPRTMCVIVARPTRSVPLFIQMVGRGLRPWLSAEAPPREEQRCILLCVSDGVTELACVADLSDRPGEPADGKTLTAMEDEWDLGRDIEPDGTPYAGPVVVERWDAAVQASSKAWKYTAGGIPFLPTAKRGEGYVFVVEQPEEGVHVHGWKVWLRRPATPGEGRGRFRVTMLATAPDLELAMSLAEDAAHDHGGDIGRLLADKNRAWRKAVPSWEMRSTAARLGLDADVRKIMNSKSAGKAGKLSDLIDKVVASRVIDPVAAKIKERVKA